MGICGRDGNDGRSYKYTVITVCVLARLRAAVHEDSACNPYTTSTSTKGVIRRKQQRHGIANNDINGTNKTTNKPINHERCICTCDVHHATTWIL